MAKNITFSNNPLFSGPSLEERSNSNIPYRVLKIADVSPDQNQPRVDFDPEKLAELTTSIKTYGVLSPILVRKSKEAGKYILVAGERRWRASQKAGLTEIPALIDNDENESEERTLAIQLVENLQRAELTSLEKAYAVEALKETNNLSVRKLADMLGISKSSVQRSLDILDLPDDLLNALRQGASESKVLLLAKIEDPKERAVLLKDLDDSTRDSLRSKVINKNKAKKTKKSGLSAEDRRIVDELQKAIGLKVDLKRASGDKGKLSINFHSEDDLQHVFRKLVS